MVQKTFIDDKEDEFVKSLNLTEDKIKEDLESMRDIEGFPIGDVEDILELSEPPYYTAYPNPYIKDFIEFYGTPYDEETDDYNVDSYSEDLKTKKNNSLYRLHSYHTKMPYEGIQKIINHYTSENDIVLDVFSGTGMTGLASKYSRRNSILIDLSPAASSISYNYNKYIDVDNLKKDVLEILEGIEKEYSWFFRTTVNNEEAIVNFYVWSINYQCPHCSNNFIYYDVAYDSNSKKMLSSFECPKCGAELQKSSCNVVFEKKFDDLLNKEIEIPKFSPILLNYSFNGQRKSFSKKLDEHDFKNIEKSENLKFINWVPTYKMLFEGKNWGDTWRAGVHAGIEYTHQFYYKRTLFILSILFDKLKKLDNNYAIFYFTSLLTRMYKSNRFMPHTNGSGVVGPLSGTLYLSQLQVERNPLEYIKSKLKDHINVKSDFIDSNYICSTQSSINLVNIPSNSIDYIFIDPPFGDNLMYSELNFLSESWLNVFTNNKSEAIINKHQNKELDEYSFLMLSSFKELFRILKPNRWITVEFHNSRSDVWKTIQGSLENAGFVIGSVSVLDKKKGTTKQLSYSGTVKNDLLINAYKPSKHFTKNINLHNISSNYELEFIEMHLNKLPLKQNNERTQKMLYSRLIAHTLKLGIFRYDATDFYELLNTHFVNRGGYWFTFSQVDKFDQKLKQNSALNDIDIQQSTLGIYDEKSSIIWLNQFLKSPKTYDEIYINFSKNLLTSFDKIPELKVILEENFILENGKYQLPSDLEKNKVEQLRNKRLIKEFNNLLENMKTSKKKVKEVRKEALFLGLNKLYKEKDVDSIKLIGERIDSKIIESDDDISAIINWAKYK